MNFTCFSNDSPGSSCQRNLHNLHTSEWDPHNWESAETEIREEILLDLNFFGVLQFIFFQGISHCSNFGHIYIIWDIFCYNLGWTHNFWSTIIGQCGQAYFRMGNTIWIDCIAWDAGGNLELIWLVFCSYPLRSLWRQTRSVQSWS